MKNTISYLLIFVLTGCSNDNSKIDKTKSNAESDNTTTTPTTVIQPVSIDENVIVPYTKKSYPKLYAQWGTSGLQKINYYLPKVAEFVAKQPECNKLENVDISDKSIPNKKYIFFADCENGQRYYIDASNLPNHNAILQIEKIQRLK